MSSLEQLVDQLATIFHQRGTRSIEVSLVGLTPEDSVPKDVWQDNQIGCQVQAGDPVLTVPLEVRSTGRGPSGEKTVQLRGRGAKGKDYLWELVVGADPFQGLLNFHVSDQQGTVDWLGTPRARSNLPQQHAA